ncbi:MAG TPA: hypothetical protein VL201_05135 [Patescibacteria group bacterium]|jgi:hypothetical protein|nr:hypothetical protein [Patescibacteria group bacterium]
MRFVSFFLLFTYLSLNANAFLNQIDLSYEKCIKQQAAEWYDDIFTQLSLEQKINLCYLIEACANFSEKLAALTRLNGILTLQSTKVQGMILGVIQTQKVESLTENILLAQSLCDTLIKIHSQYEEALEEVEHLYMHADPRVQNVFTNLSDDIYCLIDQYYSLSEGLTEIDNKDFGTSVDYVTKLFNHVHLQQSNRLHHNIIDKQSYLTIMLYQKTLLNGQTNQLYFDMLNMYVNILDTYRITIGEL